MKERVSSNDSLLRVVAVHQAIDESEIPLAIDAEVRGRRTRPELGDPRGDFLDSVGRLWMGRQPVRDASPIAHLLDPRQRGQQVRHTGRIPTRLGGVLRTEAIRLQFVIATVPQEQHAEPGLRETPKGLRARREDAADDEPQLRTGRTRICLYGMSGRDMPNLVPEDARQIRLVAQERHDAARKVEVASREGECIHGGYIDHREMPREIRPVGTGRQAEPNSLDKVLHLLVVVDTHLLPYFDI